MEDNKNIRQYLKYNCIVFRSTKGKYGSLSNMAGGFPIKIKDNWIYNSEALYQALKYPDFADIQKRIFRVKSPIVAKQISRKYSKYERNDWLNVRFKIMKLSLELKLLNNFDKFSSVLISTGDKPIVEFTKEDKIWGAIDIGEYYEGTNALGRLLMELRENIKIQRRNFKIILPQIEKLKIIDIDLKNLFE